MAIERANRERVNGEACPDDPPGRTIPPGRRALTVPDVPEVFLADRDREVKCVSEALEIVRRSSG